jgi:DNA-binding transcriptional LysR family regulator
MDLLSATARYADAFLSVCATGSITGAARALNRTQPAISYQIRKLEEALGSILLERHGRQVILTRAGRELRLLWQKQAVELEALQSQLAHGLGTPPAEYRVASVSGFGRYVLYPKLRALAAEKDNHLTLWFRTADEVLRLVDAGDADCGVVYHTRTTNRLEFTPLYREELVLIVPAACRTPAAAFRRLATYNELAFVTYEESEYVFGKWFQTNFRRQPRITRPVCTFTELEEAIDGVASGFGASIVPRDAIAAWTSHLRVVRPSGRACINQVFQVSRVGSFIPPPLHLVFHQLATG